MDGLRGVACLLVFTGHFLVQNSPACPPVLLQAFSQYWSGVDLFFVLSGFVIFLSLIRLRERTQATPRLIRLFVTSRACRILPVYAVFLSAYFVLPRLYPQLAQDEMFVTSIPGRVYLWFGQSWYMALHQRGGAEFVDASWSLCAEVFLYALSLAIICVVTDKGRIRAMVAAAAFSLAARVCIVLFTENLLAAYLLPVCRMDGFMLGGIAAVLYGGDGGAPRVLSALGRALPVLLCVFVALSVGARHFASAFSILFSYAFYSLFYSAILVAAVGGRLQSLSRAPLRFIGTISYFIYLFHLPIIYWARQMAGRAGWGILANGLAAVGATLAAATLSWFLMERPIIALGRSLNGPRGVP